MSVQTFLASSFFYRQVSGVTDCANLIAEFRTELCTNNSPAWTEPVTGTFKSPVDAADRWFDVTITAPTADRLRFAVRDKNGTTVCTREIMIDTAGTDVLIFSGECHLVVQSKRAVPEEIIIVMMDLSPEAQSAHSYYIAAFGYRNNTGATDTTSTWTSFFAKQYDGTYVAGRRWQFIVGGNEVPVAVMKSASGYWIFNPVGLGAIITPASDQATIGRCFQMYAGPVNIASGTTITVPIDTGVTADFYGLNNLPAGFAYWRFFVRKA